METNVHPVLELINERKQSGSTPGNRSDGKKLALLVEGGGMRAILSTGMCAAIEKLGLLDCFDVVYGTSAGALNALYSVARQAFESSRIYFEYANSGGVVAEMPWAMLSVFTEKPIIDLKHHFGKIVNDFLPVNQYSLNNSIVKLKLLATNVTRENLHSFDTFNNRGDIVNALVACCSMPLVTGPPFEYKGERYWDGGLMEAMPVKRAREEGATHIMAFCTKKFGAVRLKPDFFDKYLYATLMARHSKAVARTWLGNFKKYYDTIFQLKAANVHKKPVDGTFLYSITMPQGVETPTRATKDKARLVKGFVDGFRLVEQLFHSGRSMIEVQTETVNNDLDYFIQTSPLTNSYQVNSQKSRRTLQTEFKIQEPTRAL